MSAGADNDLMFITPMELEVMLHVARLKAWEAGHRLCECQRANGSTMQHQNPYQIGTK